MRLSEAAQYMNGECVGDDVAFSSVSIDSRTMAASDLFVALSGENFDGHKFLASANDSGAVAAVTSEATSEFTSYVRVADTRIALGQLAKGWLARSSMKKIAITGSSGKTTVKEMVASILQQAGETLATLGNKNNDIGVPLTMLRVEDKHQFGVFELGANHVGEIAYTSALVAPDAVVITNVAAAHVEGFGSVEKIAQCKAEIYQSLSAAGCAVVNVDDDFSDGWLSQLKAQAGVRVVTFSVDAKKAADISVRSMSLNADGHYAVQVNVFDQCWSVVQPLLGKHNIANMLAAISLCYAVGVSEENVREGLAAVQPIKGRLMSHQLAGDCLLIDDSYNANVGSVCAAIDVLSECDGQKILVLGQMGELGDQSNTLHKQVGAYAQQQQINTVITLGQWAGAVAEGFGSRVKVVKDLEQAQVELEQLLDKPSAILVKGSRSVGMEVLVDKLINVRGVA